MVTSQYPRRTAGTIIVNRQAMLRYHGSAMFAVTIRCQNHTTFSSMVVDGNRRRGRQHRPKLWSDNVKEWTDQSFSSLLRIADDRSR